MLRRVGSGEVLSPGYCPGIFSKRAGPRLQFRLEIAEYVVSVIEERYRSVFRVDPTVQAGPDYHEGEGVARLRRAADPPRMELFERYGDFDGVTRVFPLRRTPRSARSRSVKKPPHSEKMCFRAQSSPSGLTMNSK